MSQARVSIRPSLLRFALAQALVASLIPIGTAFAQSAPHVRTIRGETTIKSSRFDNAPLVMIAPRGTLLEVIHTRGDQNQHRDFNEYWVLSPPDSWGTQRVGWIPARDVEYVPAVPRPKPVAEVEITPVPRPQPVPEPAPVAAAPISVGNVTKAPVELPVSEVVLNFEFGKSDLTEAAEVKLVEAMTMLKSHAGSVTFALEGHADWIGSEGFNEKLGLARAETVKRYLADKHQVAIGKIQVVSFGETRPAASNDTRDGRAQNRRVVIKVGA